jgi:hypothetical protein
LPIVLTAMILGACAQRMAEPSVGIVPIARDLSVVLPRPSDLGRSVQVAQLVTARYGNDTYVFESHIDATPERFLMVGVDSLGRRAMTITWTDAGVISDTASWFPSSLRPENILADMTLLYWPETAVRQSLISSGGELSSGPRWRSVRKDGKEIVRIDYEPAAGDSLWSGKLHYRNIAWNYALDVQSVSGSP